MGRIELNLLQQALERANGNKKAAADMLRLKRTTLAAKLKSLGELRNRAMSV
jgi:DNA-binding NtrC family response regulator